MGGVRPNASENGQISPSTTVRAARGDGSCPNLASILPEGRKNANIHASSGIIRGIPGRIQVPKETPEPFPACSALAALSSRASKTSSGVNGLLRQYLPKGADLTKFAQAH